MPLLAVLAVFALWAGSTLRAQTTKVGAPATARTACVADPARGVAGMSGRRITTVRIASTGPERLPGGLGTPLHVTTRDATVRSRLLFAPGDTVDSLRVAESLRLLRRLRYLAGAVVTATCDSAGGGVALTVATRDAWSMKPRFSSGGSGTAAGLEETNLFGTGRAVKAYVRSEQGQIIVGAGYADPTLFGSRVLGTASHDAYRDGSAWNAALHSQDAGVFQLWGLGVVARRSARQSVTRTTGGVPGDTVLRSAGSVLVRRRVAYAPAGATFLLVGAEAERTVLVAGADLPLAGPPSVRRTFAGLDLGMGRRAGRYDIVPWLLPQSGDEAAHFAPAEIPVGFEGEGVLGLGRDLAARVPAGRVDLWAGRVWHVAGMRRDGVDGASGTPRALLSSDVWASGYRSLGTGGGEWSAGTLRGSIALVAPARRGLWSTRVSAERLIDPDPDVRGLAMADPALRALPRGSRLAETALSASLQRSVHLLGARRGYVLDGVAFGVASARWDGATPVSLAARRMGSDPLATEQATPAGAENVYVGSLGLGLQLTPTRFGRATLGVEVGFPVVRSPQVRGRPYVGLSVTPAFGFGRRRGGAAP